MNESQHPALLFAEPLKDLAEGRIEPDAWIAWWGAHAGEIEAVFKPGWFLRLKVTQPTFDANRAALSSQGGACYVLEALGVPFTRSDRYQRVWQENFERYCEQEKVRKRLQAKQLAPQINALTVVFPKFGRFLRKRADEILEMEQPADDSDIVTIEQVLGVPLPGAYRQFLKWTRGLNMGVLSLGLSHTGSHPAVLPVEQGGGAAFCIADYWLEADGDQVLLELNSSPEFDPPVFYYAHEAASQHVRILAPSFSAWLDSLPRSPVFRS